MVKKMMWVEFEGDLSPSRKTPGAHSPLVHGEDGVREQAVLYDIEDDEEYTDAEPDDGEAEISPEVLLAIVGAALVVTVAGVVVVKNVIPRIKVWWATRRLKKELATAEARENVKVDASQIVVLDAMPAESSPQPGDELEVSGDAMSNAERQARFKAMLLARAFSDAQWKKLSRARIEDDTSRELVAAMQSLTPQDVADRLNLLLEKNPTLLDDKTSAALARTFGGGHVVEGEYVPVKIERIGEALHSMDHRIQVLDGGQGKVG